MLGETKSPDPLQVLEKSNNHLFLHAIGSSFLEEAEAVVQCTVLVKCPEDPPQIVDSEGGFEADNLILLVLPGAHDSPQLLL